MLLHTIPFSAAIFDLDGLLIDSEPTWFIVESGFLKELGFIWTRDDADACMGRGTPNTLRIWKERFGVDVDIPRDTERIVDRMIASAKTMPLKPGALELLKHLSRHKVPMGVASSSPRRLIEAVLKAKGIDGYLSHVVSAQEVPRTKPAPDVFLRAAEVLEQPAAACVVFEDALAGVRAALAARCQVVAVPSVPAQRPAFQELTEFVFQSLEDVIPLVT